MGQTEIIKLYNTQQKIIQFSENYYKGKQVIGKDDIERLHAILRTAEELFPNCIVLLHSEMSERIYVSSNVMKTLNYTPDDVIRFTDIEFIERIHPDDILPVRKAMEQIYNLTQEEGYIHESIRYQINMRYQIEGADYAHITYEAVTIQYEGYFADLALIKNISDEQFFQHVELLVYKKSSFGFLKMKHYIPEQNAGIITPREIDILKLLAKGFSNEKIANSLGISVSTVKNHRGKLFRKLNVKNSLQLMNYARKNALV